MIRLGVVALVAVVAGLIATGCGHGWSGSGAAEHAPTFAGDVAPILFEHCAPCHHPGGAGPFSLLSYSDAKKRARQIAKVTSRRYMPPWLPEPGHGRFVGENRLTDAQIATLESGRDRAPSKAIRTSCRVRPHSPRAGSWDRPTS